MRESDDEPESEHPNAIETRYNGYKFRSRLEARWAVFFDTLGLSWRYEPQGFEIGPNQRYLPDFYLLEVGVRGTDTSGTWVEIKGELDGSAGSSNEDETLAQFIETVDEPVALLTNRPGNGDGEWNYVHEPLDSGAVWDNHMLFMKCENNRCDRVKYEFKESNYMTCEQCGATCTHEHPSINEAIENARSARFEHGESPDTA